MPPRPIVVKSKPKSGGPLIWSLLGALLVVGIAISLSPPDLIACAAHNAMASSGVVLEDLGDAPYWSDRYNATMMWGSYRPQLYFGLRTRTPKGLLVGLMWIAQSMHHTAEDGKINFKWRVHDGTHYGEETIEDPDNGLVMTVQWVKQRDSTWALRVTGKRSRGVHHVVRVGIYVSDEANGTIVAHGDVGVTGTHTATGPYAFILRDAKKSNMTSTWDVLGSAQPTDAWNLRPDRLSVFHPGKHHNFVLMMKPFAHDFTLEGTFAPPGSPFHDTMRGCELARTFAAYDAKFREKFSRVFPIPNPTPIQLDMAMSALSNLIGGVGYWFGDSTIAKGPGRDTVTRVPASPLVSAVPSRSKFPRGFLWDEGYHQMLIAKWLPELSKDIILHWMLQQDGNGWIAREQIRGAEARTRVPSEFVPQHPEHANPPTLVLQIDAFAQDNAHGNHSVFLKQVWPYVQKWLAWFTTSQFPPEAGSHGFQWKGQKGYHLLSCGLDDYPRPSCDGRNMHLDLYAWIALFRRTVADIAKALGEGEVYARLHAEYRSMVERLDGVHWDPTTHRYADTTGCVAANKSHSRKIGYISLFPLIAEIVENAEKAKSTVALVDKYLMSGHGLSSLANRSRVNITSDDYWTGPIWMNLNYLFLRSMAVRYNAMVGSDDVYQRLRRDLIQTATKEFERTGRLWENYDQGTGRGRGTAPFTGWTTLVVLILSNQY